MNPALIPLLILGGAAVGWFVLALARAEGKRTEALSQAASALGLVFEPRGDLDLLRATADLPLFNRGRSRQVRNVMRGRAAGEGDIKIFDYRYTTGGGKNSHTWRQTVALFPAGDGLPDFVLAPENIFHRIGKLFGYQDVDFDENREFSSRYLLRGRDETAIRAAFTSDRLAFLAGEPGWTIEARSGHLAVYKARRRVRPEELQTFVSDSQRVAQAMRAR